MSQERYNFPTKPLANVESIVSGPNFRFTILTDGLLRYEWAPDSDFEDRASTLAINRDLPVPDFRAFEKDGYLNVRTRRFHLIYDKQPFTANSLLVRVLGGLTRHHSEWRYGLPANGLGGTARTLDGVDGRIDVGGGVVSREGYAAVDDSRSMLFDGEGWVAQRKGGTNRVDGYLFAYGHDYGDAVKALYALSGPQPLLPRWTFGNWWSRFYAYSDKEYLRLMDKFARKEIPLSIAVVDMDWHYVNRDKRVRDAGMSGWTGYTWNDNLFPDPKRFCRELHDRDLKITLNDHPADGIAPYEDMFEEMAKALDHENKNEAIDFNITDRKFCDAFFDVLHRKLEDDGCDFWWSDWQSGPFSRVQGIDPLWMLNHFHFLDNKVKNPKTPVVFSRYAGPGSHRYPIGFSGDSVTTWESLDFQPEFTASASNIGYGWWSHDIGGHMRGYRNDELTARWVQLGVFSPMMRPHSTMSTWMSKEPWLYGRECEDSMTEMMRFRHRLIPYLYSMNVRAATQGEPLVQPVYWQWPETNAAYQFKNQFYFGSELLVAPITQPTDPSTRLASVKAWLPPGRHVDVFTGTVYDGDRTLTLHRKLHEIPVLAPEGSILPLDATDKPKNGTHNPDGFHLLIVVGKSNTFEIVEDDAEGNVGTVRIPISFDQAEGTLRISPIASGVIAEPSHRLWKLRFRRAAIDVRSLRVFKDKQDVTQTPGVSIGVHNDDDDDDDNNDDDICVCISSCLAESEILIHVGRAPRLRTLDLKQLLRPLLQDAQISFAQKHAVWDAVAGDASRAVRASKVEAIGLGEAVRGAILELLLADSRGIDGAGGEARE